MPLIAMTPEEMAHMRQKAAESRKATSAALAELKGGAMTVADALSGEDARLARAKVVRVLLAVPGVGKVRARRLMTAAGVAETRRVKGLKPRQRADLASLLSPPPSA
jgi:S13-like protein